jgi:hypothetical protein
MTALTWKSCAIVLRIIRDFILFSKEFAWARRPREDDRGLPAPWHEGGRAAACQVAAGRCGFTLNSAFPAL